MTDLPYSYPWEPKPCENGHEFYWSSNTTSSPPLNDLRCRCGAIAYGDAAKSDMPRYVIVGINPNENENENE